MKRTKQVSRKSSAGDSDPEFPWSKPKPPEKSWQEHMDGRADGDFAAYSLAGRFESGALVAHSKFGKGVVVSVEGARLDVLFEDGLKKLGHSG